MLFVGNKEKGFFCEDAAEECHYISADLHIRNQAEQIQRYKDEISTIIYDIEQYADEPEEIANWILRIQDALGVKTIIYAAGFSPQSRVVQLLYEKGVKNYIFSLYLGDQKEDLELCLNGYYENFGYEEKRGLTFSAEKEEEETGEDIKKEKAKCIGVAGALARIGTTTQAVQLVKYLQYIGKKAAYYQMNSHHFVEDLAAAYEEVNHDEEAGCATYMKVDMFYRMDKLQETLKRDYDFVVFDYGVYSENGFNKISFLEKDIQIFVCGSKPGEEFNSTYDVIKNNFYNNVSYIFSFVAKTEQKELLELMEEKAETTFFAEEARDPFAFSGAGSFYEKLLPGEQKMIPAAGKKHRIFGRREKR